MLELAYANGQLAAFHKLAWPAPTHPVVRTSPVLRSTAAPTTQVGGDAAKSRLTPQTLARQFDDVEQGETRIEPLRKLSADICTTCRLPKHYGTCKRPIAIKKSDFNMGMYGDDPTSGDSPSTSANYTSATTSNSALARAQDGRPAGEQAATTFAQLHNINAMADQPVQSSGSLAKVSVFIRTLQREQRGPSVDSYDERPTRGVPPAGGVGVDADRAWRSFDTVADSTCIDGGTGTPSGGPIA